MPIYYQSANPIPICGQSVNPLPIRQSLTNLPISDQSIYPMPTLDQADMTVFQPQPLHTHTHTHLPQPSELHCHQLNRQYLSIPCQCIWPFRIYTGNKISMLDPPLVSTVDDFTAIPVANLHSLFQSWTIYASLLQILDPPTNAMLIYWTMPMPMLHKVTNPLSIYQPMHLSTQPVKSTNPGPSCQFTNAMSIQSISYHPRQTSPPQPSKPKPNRLHKLGLIMDWHQLAVHWQMSCQSMMNPSHKAQFT